MTRCALVLGGGGYAASAWPEQRLLIVVVVNAETGERHAFDRNTGIDLVDAVIAISATDAAAFEG
jgi:hypothetical protein